MLRKKPTKRAPPTSSPPRPSFNRTQTTKNLHLNSSTLDLFNKRSVEDSHVNEFLFGDDSIDKSRFMTPQLKNKSRSTARLINQPQHLKAQTGGNSLNQTKVSMPFSSTGGVKTNQFKPSVGTALAIKTKGSSNFLLMRY